MSPLYTLLVFILIFQICTCYIDDVWLSSTREPSFTVPKILEQTVKNIAVGSQCPDTVQIIKVGVSGNPKDFPFSSYNTTDIANPIPSFEASLLEAICYQAHLKCEEVPLVNPGLRIPHLLSGKLDMILSRFSHSIERQYRVKILQPYYYTDSMALWVYRKHAKKTKHQVKCDKNKCSLADIVKDKKVCSIQSYVLIADLEEAGANIVELSDHDAVIEDGKNADKCDYVVTDSSQAIQVADEGYTQIPFDNSLYENPYGLVVRYSDLALAEKVERGLRLVLMAQVHEGQTQESEAQKLDMNMVELAQDYGLQRSRYLENEAWLQRVLANAKMNGKLRIGMTFGNREPMSLWNDSASNPTGFEAEFAKRICAHLKRQCTFVNITDINQRITFLQPKSNGITEADIVISLFSVTAQRLKVTHFAQPFYFSSSAALFALPAVLEKVDNSTGLWRDIVGNRTACMLEGYFVNPVTLNFLDKDSLLEVREEDRGSALKNGTCDFLVDDDLLMLSLKRMFGVRMVSGQVKLNESPLGVAIKEDDDLKRQVVQVISRMLFSDLKSELSELLEEHVVKPLKAEGLDGDVLVQYARNQVRSFRAMESLCQIKRQLSDEEM